MAIRRKLTAGKVALFIFCGLTAVVLFWQAFTVSFPNEIRALLTINASILLLVGSGIAVSVARERSDRSSG